MYKIVMIYLRFFVIIVIILIMVCSVSKKIIEVEYVPLGSTSWDEQLDKITAGQSRSMRCSQISRLRFET